MRQIATVVLALLILAALGGCAGSEKLPSFGGTSQPVPAKVDEGEALSSDNFGAQPARVAEVQKGLRTALRPEAERLVSAEMTPGPARPASSPPPIARMKIEQEPIFLPRSKNPPKGKPWQTMHEEGFTGSFSDACGAMHLNPLECDKYRALKDAGSCRRARLRNGDVVDAVTFTKGGKHRVQKNVLVDLKNPPSWDAMACDLGNGTVVGWFLGCQNHFRINGVSLPKSPTPKIEVARTFVPNLNRPPKACPVTYWLKVNVWEHTALQVSAVERTARLEEERASDPYQPFKKGAHVSRDHGGEFRKAYAKGQLQRSNVPVVALVSLINEKSPDDQTVTDEQLLSSVKVIGLQEFQFRWSDLKQWDAIRIIFSGGVDSPPRSALSGYRELRFYNKLPGKPKGEWENNPVPDCIMNVHAIAVRVPTS